MSRRRMTTRSANPTIPNGSLLALYVVAKDPERGIIIKVAGKIDTEPRHGAADDDVRKHASAAVQQVHAEVPSRRDRAAGQPPRVRLLSRRRAR